MFVGEARGLSKSGAYQVDSDLNSKHQTRQLWLARDKHSNLLPTFIHYTQKSIITLGPDGLFFNNIQSGPDVIKLFISVIAYKYG